MTDSIYQYVLDELEARKVTLPTIAEESGVNLATLKKILYRTVENPGVIHIEKLAKYFREQAAA
jgi:transcriptional regulator with XRE-family HTH domain